MSSVCKKYAIVRTSEWQSGEAVLLPGGMRGRLVRQCVIDGGVSCAWSKSLKKCRE